MADNSGVRKLSAMPRYLPFIRSEVYRADFKRMNRQSFYIFFHETWDPFS
jgi:hypothetical protein